MKRIQYRRYGGPQEMRLEDFELPPLRSGQIAVRVKAACVNPIDWKLRNGAMKFMTGNRFPRAMGNDFSGVVAAVGSCTSRLKPGDEVLGAARLKESGAFAEMLITDEKFAVAKPRSLSFEDAACLPTIGAAAWRGLVEKARVEQGQSVFINGCLGGVGRAAVQIAKMHGARAAGSCSAASIEEARRLGVDPVIDYASGDLRSLEGSFDVVYDTAGTLSMDRALALLGPRGVFLDTNPTPQKLLRGLLSSRYKMVMASQTPQMLAKIVAAAVEGRLTAVIGKTVPFGQQALAAIAELEQHATPKAKVVIVMG